MRPAMAMPVEVHPLERQAHFLLSDAVDGRRMLAHNPEWFVSQLAKRV